jgi:hypothetical protein
MKLPILAAAIDRLGAEPGRWDAIAAPTSEPGRLAMYFMTG